jgi:O-antigen/teichoic acid export membrane protein
MGQPNDIRRAQLVSRFGANFAAYGYGQAAIILAQLLQAPLFLRFWGVDRYGEWLVISGIPLALAVAEFGIAQASASKASIEAGAGEWATARDTLETARFYCIATGCLLIFAVWVSCLVLNWSSILNLSSIDRDTATSVLVLLTAALAIKFTVGYLDATMRASGHAALSGFIVATTPLAQILMSALILSGGGGMIAIAIGTLVTSIVVLTAHGWAARKYACVELAHRGSAGLNQMRAILKPASGFVGISLAQALTVQGGVQMLNQLASAQAVVAFSMIRIAVRTLLNLGAVINNSLRPEFSLLIGAGKKEEAVHFLKRVWLLACGVGLIGYIALVLCGPSVLNLWSSGEVHGSHILFALVGIHALLSLIWYVPMSLDMSENRHTRPSMVYLLTAIASMIIWVAYRADLQPWLGASLLLAAPEFAMCLMVARYCKLSSVKNCN